MLVYGDEQKDTSTGEFLERLRCDAGRLAAVEPGLARHQALVEIFIDFASLLQGVADRERELHGYDECSVQQDRLMQALRLVAETLDRSWRTRFEDQAALDWPSLLRIDDVQLQQRVTVKRCEGYAFYGLYPEAYLEAARGLRPGTVVVGLRSIGAGLAALVSAASGAETVITLRPCGHPFSRSVKVGPRLEKTVRALAERHFAVVDEGPGLSGSSFGGVADWLEGLGVARERIIFMPSHEGDLGPEAAAGHRQRWAGSDKRVRTFEQLFTSDDAPAPLQSWFGDVTGTLVDAPKDLSGGGWASHRPATPTDPSREARKFLLHGKKGEFILKYAGIDAAGRAKFERAKALHRAGFCAEPLALRYGFIIERFIEGEPAARVPGSLLVDYCTFRRNRFPARKQGSSLEELVKMAEYNIAKAAPEIDFDPARRWNGDRLSTLQAAVRPVHIDGRMHKWEWLRSHGRILKTDAVDHSESHDLVGCQDIMWDVAGAVVELGDSDDAAGEVTYALARAPQKRELLDLMKVCYAAFQLGWWSMSSTTEGWARSNWYRGRIADLLPAQA